MPDVRTLTTVTVRYFAAARAAAGVELERLDVPAGGTVARPAGRRPRAARRGAGPGAGALLLPARRGRRARPATALPDDATLDVLPPFAGG